MDIFKGQNLLEICIGRQRKRARQEEVMIAKKEDCLCTTID